MAHIITSLFYLYFGSSEFLFDFSLVLVSGSSFQLSFLLDFFSSQFLSFIILISSVVIFYSSFYMHADLVAFRFLILVVLFVFSIALLVLSPSLLRIIFGWDGLGVTSFLLVIYYNNVSSLRSGIVTIYTNRIGDIFLIFRIFFILSLGWISFDSFFFTTPLVLFILITLAGITKSAQLPFSSWLPAAIAAPTPVSSLVHSSTLVTAGVYVFIRFFFLFDKLIFMFFFVFIFLMTSLSAGVFACLEVDLKRLVAMSTLSQLGLMITALSLGHLFYSFFHMVSHALFKSLLFLSCGFFIITSLGLQDIRFAGNKFFSRSIVVLIVFIANLRLCGFPFFSGFFSRDLILETFFGLESGVFLFAMFFLSCVFSVVYSFKMVSLRVLNDLFNSPMIIGSLLIFSFILMSILFLWSIFLGKVFVSFFLGGELSLFHYFDKTVGVWFFLLSVIFMSGFRLFFLFFSDMLWLNWVRGSLISKAQPYSYLILLGEYTWLEAVGPKGVVHIFFIKVFNLFSWGVSKPIFLLFFTLFLLFLVLLPYSLWEVLFWRNREGW